MRIKQVPSFRRVLRSQRRLYNSSNLDHAHIHYWLIGGPEAVVKCAFYRIAWPLLLLNCVDPHTYAQYITIEHYVLWDLVRRGATTSQSLMLFVKRYQIIISTDQMKATLERRFRGMVGWPKKFQNSTSVNVRLLTSKWVLLNHLQKRCPFQIITAWQKA